MNSNTQNNIDKSQNNYAERNQTKKTHSIWFYFKTPENEN